MRKKILPALIAAGLLVFGSGAAAATAAEYPSSVTCTVSPTSVAVGGNATVTCTGFMPNSTVSFTSTGGSIASLVFTATTATKTADASGSVSTVFTAPTTAGSYTVTASGTAPDESAVTGSATITVTAAAGGGGGAGLPATGGTVPAAAIWLGVGAIGIGGIAVAAAVARRRASQR
jgi:hypothetical protein